MSNAVSHLFLFVNTYTRLSNKFFCVVKETRPMEGFSKNIVVTLLLNELIPITF